MGCWMALFVARSADPFASIILSFTEKSLLTNLVMGLAAEARLSSENTTARAVISCGQGETEKPGRRRAHVGPNDFIELAD